MNESYLLSFFIHKNNINTFISAVNVSQFTSILIEQVLWAFLLSDVKFA